MHEKTASFNHAIDLVMGIGSGLLTALTATLITLPAFNPATRDQNSSVIYAIILFISASVSFI